MKIPIIKYSSNSVSIVSGYEDLLEDPSLWFNNKKLVKFCGIFFNKSNQLLEFITVSENDLNKYKIVEIDVHKSFVSFGTKDFINGNKIGRFRMLMLKDEDFKPAKIKTKIPDIIYRKK